MLVIMQSEKSKSLNVLGLSPILGRFCSAHNTYENYVRCLRTTNVKIGFACAFGPTYVLLWQIQFFFLARNKRFGGIGGRLIRTGLRMKQGSDVFSVWIFRMRKRAQRMSNFKRNSINSNVQQNLPTGTKTSRSTASISTISSSFLFDLELFGWLFCGWHVFLFVFSHTS